MCNILLVDDTDSQRAWLRMVISNHRGDWNITECASLPEALEFLDRSVGAPPFAAAVVDQFLSVPARYNDPEGLTLLGDLLRRDPRCLRILVTGKNTKEWELPNDGRVNVFVSIAPTNQDRRSQLEDALDRAFERYDAYRQQDLAAFPE